MDPTNNIWISEVRKNLGITDLSEIASREVIGVSVLHTVGIFLLLEGESNEESPKEDTSESNTQEQPDTAETEDSGLIPDFSEETRMQALMCLFDKVPEHLFQSADVVFLDIGSDKTATALIRETTNPIPERQHITNRIQFAAISGCERTFDHVRRGVIREGMKQVASDFVWWKENAEKHDVSCQGSCLEITQGFTTLDWKVIFESLFVTNKDQNDPNELLPLEVTTEIENKAVGRAAKPFREAIDKLQLEVMSLKKKLRDKQVEEEEARRRAERLNSELDSQKSQKTPSMFDRLLGRRR